MSQFGLELNGTVDALAVTGVVLVEALLLYALYGGLTRTLARVRARHRDRRDP